MRKILITGGAGFIGSNLSAHFLEKGWSLTVFDNFKRRGTRSNFSWLKNKYPAVKMVEGDIRNETDLVDAIKGQEVVIHLAAQVAVTTSVVNPREDFDINALGTFNMLEAVRKSGNKPIVIFSSTNKVYGGMEKEKVVRKKEKYAYRDLPNGVSEKMCLDFHSPYGCSKGAADQYTRDYFRIYGIPTVVFRQSCIYGPRQFGIEDQGWIAWFIIALTLGKPITIYGDGMQVRDVLYIDDLVRLFDCAITKINTAKGKVYNVGGGKENTLSVWTQFCPLLEKLFQRKITPKFADWRPGDQKVFVSDISYVKKELNWSPKISVEEGVTKLFRWINANKSLFE